MSGQHMNVKEVGIELAVSEDQVKKLIEKGRLPAVNIGLGKRTFWRISRADLDAYLDTERAATARQYGGAA